MVNQRKPTPVAVLAVADPQDDLRGLTEALSTAVRPIEILTDEDRSLQTLAAGTPVVLLLAFSSLELSQAFYLRALKRRPRGTDELQTIVLCDRTEAQKAYGLVSDDVIDDYLVARPLYDPFQLALCVKHARDRLTVRRWVVEVTSAARERPIAALISDLDAAIGVQAPRSLRLQQALAELKLAATDLSSRLQHGASLVEETRAIRDAATAPPPLTSREPAATVLVVDDDEFYLRVVSDIFESAGYSVLSTTSSEGALAVLDGQAVDLVMMDVEMAGLSGIEATRRIRSTPSIRTIPIIMLTGHSEHETVVEALAAGASDFVVKPASRASLLAKAGNALRQRPHRGGVRQ